MSHPADPVAVFDKDKALEALDGDLGLLLEIAQMLLADERGRMEEIREALERRDAAALQCQAHKFRGSLATLGATLATAATQTLESLAAEGDFSKIGGAVGDLDREVGRLRSALEKLVNSQV